MYLSAGTGWLSESGQSQSEDGRESIPPRAAATTPISTCPVRAAVSNDETEAWNDPPGVNDDDGGTDESTLVGPLTFPDVVFGVHAVVALALVPFVWSAFQAGNLPLVGSLGLLVGLLLMAGVVMRRIAARR